MLLKGAYCVGEHFVALQCLSVAGPTVAQLEVFFSSDYL